jgi:glycosyltransferase involved in cell wall biosynthesis
VAGWAGCRVLDGVAKGAAELGHSVYYYLEQGFLFPPPKGIIPIDKPTRDVDIMHVQDEVVLGRLSEHPDVWVRTVHVDVAIRGEDRKICTGPQFIYVSKTCAAAYGSTRYVWNGIDPSEFLYSEVKDNYFLFVAGAERVISKGLDIAADLSNKLGFHLVVAGSSWSQRFIDDVTEQCKRCGASYVGEIYGTAKAVLFANARALLFPTKWNESFGLVQAEALMSGTPVICSDNGACPELITPDVGFVCRNEDDYIYAVKNIGEVSPKACREKAMRDFHYRTMATGYLKEYESAICAK